MISLILPYWNRQVAADIAITRLNYLYGGWKDLEVIVVDDGSPVPFEAPVNELNLRILRLPRKTEPKSPGLCWNEGVKAALGDVVVLSCVEILHEHPILAEMERAVREGGPKAYVLAAAWCPEEQKWHCHSSVNPPHNAPGTGAAFCGAMHKSLYEAAGGWDMDYRESGGYEDCDFINRMVLAGAKFIKRDDLVVTHPKGGASTAWDADKFQQNRIIYEKKWPTIPLPPHVTFVCLKAGPMYGAEYVNILHDMVQRNLPLGQAGRFVCITDDPAGLDSGIETMALPWDLERWWGKLWMFKRGLFADGSRMIFMDLDTCIVGGLDQIIQYSGPFATLRDFVHSDRLGPAIIAWEAGGEASRIWDEWEAAGKPRNPGGDLWWINQIDGGKFAENADKLQDLFPGQFCSFKLHAQPVFPMGVKVVCFHGEPRPHNCGVEWVKYCWKVGGGTGAELAAVCNTVRDTITSNVRSSIARGHPWLERREPHDGQAVIVGGAPSLAKTVGQAAWRSANGQTVFALNNAARYCRDHGVKVAHQVILDARPENAAFLIGCHAFLASSCAPETFDAAAGDVTLYHVNAVGVAEGLDGREADLISTGSTVLLIALGIAYTLGFRTFHLIGVDSSYEDDAHHAYPQSLNDQDQVITAMAGGRAFKCAPWMVHQVQQFQQIAAQLANDGCEITVAGDGLLPHVAHEMMADKEAA